MRWFARHWGESMADWRSLTISDLCLEAGGGIQTGPFGSQLHASDYVEDGTPSVMPQNIGDNRILTAGIARVGDEDMSRLKRYWLRTGDIVYSRRGDIERRALVRAENDGWLCGTGCLRIRVGDQDVHDSRFVAYALGLEKSRKWLVRHAVGATMLNLNTEILGRAPILVPVLSEQRAIAEVLEALDDKIAANGRVVRTVGELTDAIYQQVRSSTRTYDRTFGDVAAVSGGGTPSTRVPEYWDGLVWWATPTDVTRLQAPYLPRTARTITELGLRACASKLHPAGSILMTSRATIGAFALAQCPVAVNQGFIVVNAIDDRNQLWLYHDMRSRVREFLSHANGATFLELPRGRFKSMPVSLPEGDSVNAFNDAVLPLHHLGAQIMREAGALSKARDELLVLLMSGRARVRDAEKAVEEMI